MYTVHIYTQKENRLTVFHLFLRCSQGSPPGSLSTLNIAQWTGLYNSLPVPCGASRLHNIPQVTAAELAPGQPTAGVRGNRLVFG